MNRPLRYSWGHFFSQGPLEIVARKWQHRQCVNFPAHDHQFIEIVVVTEGRIVQLSTSGETELTKNDVVVLRPGSWHAYGEADSVTAYNLCFTNRVLNVHLPTIILEPAIQFLLHRAPALAGNHGVFRFRLKASETSEIENILKQLQENKKSRHIQSNAEKLGLLALCLSRLAEVVFDESAVPAGPNIVRHPLARKAIRFIEQDILESCSLNILAEKLNTNKSYLARIFKQTTGFSVTEYIKQLRCEAAAVMLLSTDMQIGEISENVGYDDQNYFSRCFKKHFGITANQYRCRAGGQIE